MNSMLSTQGSAGCAGSDLGYRLSPRLGLNHSFRHHLRIMPTTKTSVDRVSDVTAQLERMILNGELAIGEFLPAERRLSVQLGVSRSVVREALGRLSSVGLLESRHGSGTRVAVPTGRQIAMGYERLLKNSDARLDDLVVVRIALETTIAGLAAAARTDAHLAKLEVVQRILASPRRSLAAHVKADLEFHAVLAEATGNRFFSLVLAPIHDLLIDSRLKTLERYGAAIAHAHHAKILDAVRAGDSGEGSPLMHGHIRRLRECVGGCGNRNAKRDR